MKAAKKRVKKGKKDIHLKVKEGVSFEQLVAVSFSSRPIAKPAVQGKK